MRHLIESIIRISNIASEDVLRMSINGVFLDRHDGKLRLRATDGRAFTEELIETDLDLGSGIIYLAWIAALKAFLKGLPRHVNELVASREGNILKFSYAGSSVGVDIVPNDYPDTERIKVKNLKGYTQVSFNPHLLMSLYKAMNVEKRNETITLFIDHDNSCVTDENYKGTLSTIHVEHGDRRGVLMPMRKTKINF